MRLVRITGRSARPGEGVAELKTLSSFDSLRIRYEIAYANVMKTTSAPVPARRGGAVRNPEVFVGRILRMPAQEMPGPKVLRELDSVSVTQLALLVIDIEYAALVVFGSLLSVGPRRSHHKLKSSFSHLSIIGVGTM